MLSQKAKLMKASPTLALNARAKKMASEGHDVIALSVGEPDWNSFPSVIAKAKTCLDDGLTKYAPSNGIPELRKAIANQISDFLNLKYSVDEVSVTSGAKFSIFSSLQALLDPQDEVIIPAPYWVSYPTMVELSGGKPVIVSCDESTNFKLSASLLQNAITQKTKILILNSPSNPTGLMYSREELTNLSKVLLDHPHIAILTDDIYNQLVFNGEARAPHLLQVCPDLRERCLMIDGASKAYSMTGWRVGWTIGPKAVIDVITNYQSQTVSCAASFSQWATIPAITEESERVKTSVVSLKERRDFLASQLKDINALDVHIPDGTFYFWIGVKKLLGKSYNGKSIKSSADFCESLLNEEKLVVVPGNEFGMDGYLRLSFAVQPEKLTEAAKRLARFISRLQ